MWVAIFLAILLGNEICSSNIDATKFTITRERKFIVFTCCYPYFVGYFLHHRTMYSKRRRWEFWTRRKPAQILLLSPHITKYFYCSLSKINGIKRICLVVDNIHFNCSSNKRCKFDLTIWYYLLYNFILQKKYFRYLGDGNSGPRYYTSHVVRQFSFVEFVMMCFPLKEFSYKCFYCVPDLL